MKNINRIIYGIILLTVFKAIALSGPGETAVGFLTLGNGARAMGMGEAQVGLVEGVDAMYWNPAGLALAKHHEVMLTQLQYFEDASHQYGALALPLRKGNMGTLGLSLTQFSIDNIESRDASNALLGSVEEKDASINLAYGFKLFGPRQDLARHGVLLGLGVKRVSQDLAGASDDTLSFDFGTQVRFGPSIAERWGQWLRRTSFGISLLNAGGEIKFDREKEDMPQELKAGVGYTHFIFGDALNLAFDVTRPKTDSTRVSGGVEFWFKNILALRAGYRHGQDIGEGIRAGAGFRFKLLQLDYAWAGYGDELDNVHRFTLKMRFGREAQGWKEGIQEDLTTYYLNEAQSALAGGLYHEAVLNANRVLEIESRNPIALQVLFEAGEKMKNPGSLPEPKQPTQVDIELDNEVETETEPEPETKPETELETELETETEINTDAESETIQPDEEMNKDE